MESRHRCRLCFKKFANGRALGGHMRSHMMNPPSTATPFKPPPPPPPPHNDDDRHQETELPESETSTSSPSSDEETDDDDDSTGKGLTSYELPRREKLKQRGGVSRLADPEPSLLRLPTEAAGSSSGIIMLQDRESETESSKKPTRRRSKRNRRSFLINDIDTSNTRCYYVNDNNNNNNNHNKVQENSNEGEPVSSISEVSPEEDVAFCLMMLSQDKWNRGNQMNKKTKKKRKMKKIHDDDGGGNIDADIKNDVDIDDDSDDGDKEEEEEEVKLSESTQVSDHEEELTFTKSKTKNNNNNSNSRGKYKCETCSKVFRSYQALGGHRASHKKFRVSVAAGSTPENKKGFDGEDDERKIGSHQHGGEEEEKKKIHECPVCLRVFASGQALGGHKRSHVIIDRGERRKVAEELEESKEDIVRSGKWIDLNLPAPIDDDYEISQIAVSAVSDSVNL